MSVLHDCDVTVAVTCSSMGDHCCKTGLTVKVDRVIGTETANQYHLFPTMQLRELLRVLVLLSTIICQVYSIKVIADSISRSRNLLVTSHIDACNYLGNNERIVKDVNVHNFRAVTLLSTLFSLLIPLTTTFPSTAHAELGPLITEKEVIVYFKGDAQFLKNPVLEAIRKFDQIDPDTEFQNVNKVILLVPIVDILKDIESVSKLISANEADLVRANDILTNKKFDTAPFKKAFNRYSDNIYYSDPERANIYLAGGAVPNTQQTTQYLFRNSALTSIGDVKEDVKLLLDDVKKKKAIDPQTVADAIDDCREALEAMVSYFELADPADVKEARSIVYNSIQNS